MITVDDARALRDAGLRWHPASGDAFTITRPELEGEAFTVSDMTIEAHEFDTGTILGFNGTTEWALDSVAIEDTLWLPREDQLRTRLGSAFRALRRGDGATTPPVAGGSGTRDVASPGYTVVTAVDGSFEDFAGETPESAYARALIALIARSSE
jgi:hypothetical protein